MRDGHTKEAIVHSDLTDFLPIYPNLYEAITPMRVKVKAMWRTISYYSTNLT